MANDIRYSNCQFSISIATCSTRSIVKFNKARGGWRTLPVTRNMKRIKAGRKKNKMSKCMEIY